MSAGGGRVNSSSSFIGPSVPDAARSWVLTIETGINHKSKDLLNRRAQRPRRVTGLPFAALANFCSIRSLCSSKPIRKCRLGEDGLRAVRACRSVGSRRCPLMSFDNRKRYQSQIQGTFEQKSAKAAKSDRLAPRGLGELLFHPIAVPEFRWQNHHCLCRSSKPIRPSNHLSDYLVDLIALFLLADQALAGFRAA